MATLSLVVISMLFADEHLPGLPQFQLRTTFPRKVYVELAETLEAAGLTPNASLIAHSLSIAPTSKPTVLSPKVNSCGPAAAAPEHATSLVPRPKKAALSAQGSTPATLLARSRSRQSQQKLAKPDASPAAKRTLDGAVSGRHTPSELLRPSADRKPRTSEFSPATSVSLSKLSHSSGSAHSDLNRRRRSSATLT